MFGAKMVTLLSFEAPFLLVTNAKMTTKLHSNELPSIVTEFNCNRVLHWAGQFPKNELVSKMKGPDLKHMIVF